MACAAQTTGVVETLFCQLLLLLKLIVQETSSTSERCLFNIELYIASSISRPIFSEPSLCHSIFLDNASRVQWLLPLRTVAELGCTVAVGLSLSSVEISEARAISTHARGHTIFNFIISWTRKTRFTLAVDADLSTHKLQVI